MMKRAQEMMQLVQDGFRNTMRVVADLAESVGVPPAVTSLLQPKNGADEWAAAYEPPPAPRPTPVPSSRAAEATPAPAAPAPAAPAPSTPAPAAPKAEASGGNGNGKSHSAAAVAEASEAAETVVAKPPTTTKKRTNKRRELVGDKARSKDVRQLEVDDAIDGSTYLARIIWSLGVASLEGIGPLRPADIARMVMSRSAVSLEPPNVARYIRRSKPQSITVDHTEGGSNFYKLNAKGKKLFEENFGGSL